MGVVCPKCDKDDQVRSVVSIVTEQSLTYSDALGTLAGTGSLSSFLAQRLAPPREPKRSGVGWMVTLLALSFFFFPPAYIMYTTILTLRMPRESRKKKLFVVSWLIMPLLFLLGILGLFLLSGNDQLRTFFILLLSLISLFPTIGIFGIPLLVVAEEITKRSKVYQEQLSSWNRAIEKWRRLYYCARDDGVFLEGDRLVPVEQMHLYLGFPFGT